MDADLIRLHSRVPALPLQMMNNHRLLYKEQRTHTWVLLISRYACYTNKNPLYIQQETRFRGEVRAHDFAISITFRGSVCFFLGVVPLREANAV